MAKPRKDSGAALARQKKKEASLAGWRVGGTQEAAAKAAPCHAATVAAWVRTDPDYAAQVSDALDEYIAWSGRLVHSAAMQHVGDVLARRRVPVKWITKNGVETVIEEVPQLNPALARLILVRYDPRYAGLVKEMLQAVAETAAEYFRRLDREETPDGSQEAGTPEG